MSAANNNASNNPGNFANRPTEEVEAIASMGGKAAHANDSKTEENNAPAGRNPDGTFTKDSGAAKESGHLGGLHANSKVDEKIEGSVDTDPGRNSDGTFVPGSTAAKEAGHLGGLHTAGKLDENESGRNEDGTFKAGSKAAKEAGHKGGLAAAGN